jgi:hypothetical protein
MSKCKTALDTQKVYSLFAFIFFSEKIAHFFRRFYEDPLFGGDFGDDDFRMMISFLSQLGTKETFIKYAREITTNPYTGKCDFFIKKPTASEESRNATKAYNIMQIHFALALRNPTLKQFWVNAFQGGIDNLLKEMKEKGPRYFFTHVKGDKTLEGAKGGLFYDAVMGYIKYIGQKGFSKLLQKAENLPPKMTGEELVREKLLDISSEEQFTREPTTKYKWSPQFHT